MYFKCLNNVIYVRGASQNNKHLWLRGQLVKLNTVN
jgi:hypothetical protein